MPDAVVASARKLSGGEYLPDYATFHATENNPSQCHNPSPTSLGGTARTDQTLCFSWDLSERISLIYFSF
jgi:hypothetical protein